MNVTSAFLYSSLKLKSYFKIESFLLGDFCLLLSEIHLRSGYHLPQQ